MTPKYAEDLDDVSVGGGENTKAVSNEDLIADAGKVHLDPAQPWGRGMIADVKRTVGTHWVSEMTNFNQKTVAVSLLMFITVSHNNFCAAPPEPRSGELTIPFLSSTGHRSNPHVWCCVR